MDSISKIAASHSNIEHEHMNSAFLDGASETAGSTFFNEINFNRLLSVEKKRAERSGHRSLLMLLNLHYLTGNGNCSGAIQKLKLVLSSILRKSDIIGWWKSNSVIGIILSEIGDSDLIEARETILAKFKKSLAEGLGGELADSIRIDFEPITKKGKWKNGNSVLNLRPYDSKKIPGKEEGFACLLKTFLGKGAFLVLVDLLIVSVAQIVGFLPGGGTPVYGFKVYANAYILTVSTYLLCSCIFGLHDVEMVFRKAEILLRITLSMVFMLVIFGALVHLVPGFGYAKDVIWIQTGVAWGLLIGWRFLYKRIFLFSKNKIPTLIVGAGEMGKSALQLLSSPNSRFEVTGFLDDDPANIGASISEAPPVLGTCCDLFEVISKKGVKAVVLAMENSGSAKTTRRLMEARLHGQEVYDLPTLYERMATRIPVNHVEDRWFVFAEGFHLISKEYVRKLKRIFDFLFSGTLLFCSLPLIAVTALAIKVDSAGPVFFRQTRIGKGGKSFTLLKFRSMCVDAETHGARWAQKKDPRVTKTGRIIRLLHIDELPQVWNVLVGDMSMIGPRPERPEFVKKLEKLVPYYCVRHTVRPGITGWAQIKYPYGASVEDSLRKLEYDLFYIKNMSVLQDFKILLQTIGVVIMGKGAR